MLLERVGHCAAIAVEFDEIAAFGVFLQFQCVDEGLRVDGFVGDGVALESGRERGRVGRYCGRHFCRGCCEVLFLLGVVKKKKERWSFLYSLVDRFGQHMGARACVVCEFVIMGVWQPLPRAGPAVASIRCVSRAAAWP